MTPSIRPLDVLVIEDSDEYRDLVCSVLELAGHEVRSARTWADGDTEIRATAPDLVVLDLELPDGDGLDLCRVIQEHSNAHVLMLTGRNHEVDKLIGFRVGADDYVTKPFSPRELAARVNAVARRRSTAPGGMAERKVGNLTIRPLAREVEVDGAAVGLTKLEFDLLDLLAAQPDRVFRRDELIERVWGADWYGDERLVNVHVRNLRKKLAAVTDHEVVRTVRGVGYGLAR